MTENISSFARIVAETFQSMVRGDAPVFVAGVDGDVLNREYLGAFPEGTNPMFRKKTEHDCAVCRHFIRRIGAVVRVRGRELETVWDDASRSAPAPYREVAGHLREVVSCAAIVDLFRVPQKETSFGAEMSRVIDLETKRVTTWRHLYSGEIPRGLLVASPDQVRGDYRTTQQVFARGLVELTPGALDTVISLVDANALYRGEEHKPALMAFRAAQREFLACPEGRERDAYAWANAGSPAARFRNTVIGTLVQDLSEGQEIERAVKSFEVKVAPQNYKRTTALITPGMVKQAMATIEELGLESALERRFAVMRDISIQDVLWVDGDEKPLMKGGIEDVLMKHSRTSRAPVVEEEERRAEDISIEDFVQKVLPETQGLELLFRGKHLGNLMSITAPCDPAPKRLFRWSNDFAWSYGGNVADSIAERVKRAGGKVEGAMLRISLSWFNYDDLDLHVHEPPGRGLRGFGDHIFFGNKRGASGGTLDVDMNAGSGQSRAAVENIVWSTVPPDGPYRVVVNNYQHRETQDPGFVVEVESAGKLQHYSFNKAVRGQQDIAVVTLHVKAGAVERVDPGDPGITAANISQDRWGLQTEQFVRVRAVTLSPNYWGGEAVGNRHTFFVLEGAQNDEPTRGFYNEFLHPRLEQHRKVFEVIADKTKCRPTEGQLSGLGFSSTKKDQFIARAQQDKRQRVFNVRVGA